jgi:2-methylcitrate dehydratase PrpD
MSSGTTSELEALGAFVEGLRWSELPETLKARLLLILFDTLGVTLIGAATPELEALVAAHNPPPGPARLMGHSRDVVAEEAVYLNATAACCLELDEGSKFAGGHPATHAFFASLGLAQEHHVSGDELCASLLAGYEVAARFGRATSLNPSVHPHGNWGTAGAAAAAARLLGLDRYGIARAIDAAAGLALATPFESARQGSFVRNTWLGASNMHGIRAARLAAAGLSGNDGTALQSLGSILGSFNPGELTDRLADRFDCELNYFKRHACCAFTHSAADAALSVRDSLPDRIPNEVEKVTVETHHLAASLDRRSYPTRLAAMFSLPYVTAVALATGDCLPKRFDAAHRCGREILRLADQTEVKRSSALDDRLPHERAARVTVTFSDGTTAFNEVANQVGDTDHHSFDYADVWNKLDPLLASANTTPEELWRLVESLSSTDDVSAVLAEIP